MRRPIVAALLSLLVALAAGAGERTRGWFTSRSFLACEESLYISCSELTVKVSLNRDSSVETEHAELKGRWELANKDRIRIGQHEFVFLPREGLFVSPMDSSLQFGIALVEDSSSGREALEARGQRLRSPEWQRQVANLYLRKEIQVHDACLTLTEVGDRSSIEPLLRVLPGRPANPATAGVVCTYAHCAAALTHITGRSCGVYREDWSRCLAEKN